MIKENELQKVPAKVFADPSVDFAFKRIFGSERFKAATIGLLNSIIKSPVIQDVSFEPTEVLGDIAKSRNSIIDVLCTTADGTKFIVEMQKARQEHFRERMIFYTSKLIANQGGIKGSRFDYDIKPVHVVSFINFDFSKKAVEEDKDAEVNKPVLRYKTTETELGSELPGSSRYYFLNIPRFKKNTENLDDSEEIWLSLLRDSKFLDKIPEQCIGNEAFEAYFEASRILGFTPEENQKYVEDMMNEWDIQNALDEAVKEAREEGREKGRIEIAGKLLAKGMPVEQVAELTGISVEELTKLQYDAYQNRQ